MLAFAGDRGKSGIFDAVTGARIVEKLEYGAYGATSLADGGLAYLVWNEEPPSTNVKQAILFDDHIRDGTYRDESTLVGLELLPFGKNAVLLLGTVEGVYAFLVEEGGKVSPLPTQLK